MGGFPGGSVVIIMYVCSVASTVCDPMDCRPPGFSVHGISQARILEWVALSSSRGSSKPEMEPMPAALQVDALLVPANAGDANSIPGPGRSHMPTCVRVTKLTGHNYRACAREPGKHN